MSGEESGCFLSGSFIVLHILISVAYNYVLN